MNNVSRDKYHFPHEEPSHVICTGDDNSASQAEDASSRPIRGEGGWHVVLREHRHLQFARAALVGVGAGAIGVCFQYALLGAESTRSALLHRLHA